ncbi:hypothetical protein EMCRGX_G022792 [Ephydatia muelleri]
MKISILAVFLAVLVAIASAGGNGYYGGPYSSRGYGKMRSYNAHTKLDSSNRCLLPGGHGLELVEVPLSRLLVVVG